ncbi:MAG: hypothetical protein AB7V00_04390 [Bacilli bacterium]
MDVWTQLISITLLKALAITLVCELTVALLFKVNKKFLLVCFMTNIITNVSMNIIILKVNPVHYHLFVVLLEIITIFIEFCIYLLFLKQFKKAFLLSLIANLASYLIGMLLMGFIY